MNFQKIKLESKEVLLGNRLMLLVAMIIVGAISGAFATMLIGIILAPILFAGLFLATKKLFENRKLDFNHLFEYFKDFNHAAKLIGVNFLTGLLVLLGTLLLIIPGIIFAYQYSQALFIMAEDPNLGVMDAMRKSKEMMKGYKFDFFVFQLSFILHILLGVITFGIYLIYFMPYYQAAMVNYYRHLSGQNVEVLASPAAEYYRDEFDNSNFD